MPIIKNGCFLIKTHIIYVPHLLCLKYRIKNKKNKYFKAKKLSILQNVAKKILKAMGIESNQKYEAKEILEFKGVYAGQYPITTKNDKIIILTNEMLENCKVYNYEKNEETKIYNMDKTKAYDKYDIYLSGATPLLRIDNPNSSTNKELIIFRDSYGSSLTPLLVEGYKKITVVDTRYISSKILNQYIEFTNQDVIFEYSTSLINDSITIK